MITDIEIENFRGIAKGSLNGLTNLVILVGPNNSGKSALLDAFLVGAHANPGDSVGRVVRRKSAYDAWRWLIRRPDSNEGLRICTKFSGGKERQVRILEVSPSRSDSNGALQAVINQSGRDQIAITTEFMSNGKYEPPHLLVPIEGQGEIRLVDPKVLGFAQQQLHVPFSAAFRRGAKGRILEYIRATFPDVEDIAVLQEEEGGEVERWSLFLMQGAVSVPVALLGDGTQVLIRLAIELAQRDRGTVLLEEPEVHQHPYMLRQSARTIVEAVHRGTQVIMTTHSQILTECIVDCLHDFPGLHADVTIKRIGCNEAGVMKSYTHFSHGNDGGELREAFDWIGDDLNNK